MKILLAVDGSEFGERAIEAVAEGAWEQNSSVRIITAIEPNYLPVAEGVVVLPVHYEEIGKVEREQAARTLERAAARVRAGAGGSKLAIETKTIIDSAKRAILDEAREWGADLIVVGSHGRGFWARSLIGSVSQAVVSGAECSVLIAR